MTVKPYDTDESKTRQVRTMFDRIAPRYDLLNHTLSFNIDRLWRRHTVRIVRRDRPVRIVDMATGTGDLAIAMARALPEARITGVDLSDEMLAVARRKIRARGLEERIDLRQGDAEHLDLPSESVDVVTAAFGVRNFSDPEAGLRELRRLLRPGGRIVILEFSTPSNPVFRALYRFYSGKLLPLIGGAVSHEKRAYEYLPASVDAFPSGQAFLRMLERAGFEACRARSQSFGIAHIYTGIRQ